MSLTTTRSHASLASALTVERYGPTPPSYEVMRALARASRHNNTCAVAAFPATATPDVWPGEPVVYAGGTDVGPFRRCRCGAVVPMTDMRSVHAGTLLDELYVCLDCLMQRRQP